MEDVTFANKRFDADITPFLDLAKPMAKAFGYTGYLKVKKHLSHLPHLRVAQKNECAHCMILYADAAGTVGIATAKVDDMSSWWNSELYSEKEKVALAYCYVLWVGPHKKFQKYYDALVPHFSEVEIAAIAINMNLWMRLKLVQCEITIFT